MASRNRKRKPKNRPSTTRALSSTAIVPHPMSGALQKSLEGPFQLNKFQIDGPRAAYEAKTLKDSWLLYVRVDMPGVEDDEAKVTWDEKKVCFVGEAPKQTELEAEDRSYKGELDFTIDPVQIHDVKSDLKNGVLRMVLVGFGFKPGFSTSSSHFTSHPCYNYLELLRDDLYIHIKQSSTMSPPAELRGFYPFQVGGTKGTLESKVLNPEEEGKFVYHYRVDMPDVPEGGVKFQVRENHVLYCGEGVDSKYDDKPRSYFGTFTLGCGCCKVKEACYEIKAGVLRILIQSEKMKKKKKKNIAKWKKSKRKNVANGLPNLLKSLYLGS